MREQVGSLRREISTQEYLTLIADLGKAGVKRVAFTGGEPALRADVVSLAEAVKKEGIAPNMTTNATGTTDVRCADPSRTRLDDDLVRRRRRRSRCRPRRKDSFDARSTS